MKLIDIARLYPCAPADAGGGAGGGAQPAAGAGGAAAAGGGTKDGGGAAADGAGKKDGQTGGDTGGGAGDQAKAKDGDATPAYVVKAPDGVKVDEARMKGYADWAQQKGFSAEHASAALEYYLEAQKSADKESTDLMTKADSDWLAGLKSDKDFGGANFDANLAAAQKAMVRFGGEELGKFLHEARIGNHPLLVKAFLKIGKAIAEDSSQVETAPKGDEPKPGDAKTRAAKMYDSTDSQRARGSNQK